MKIEIQRIRWTESRRLRQRDRDNKRDTETERQGQRVGQLEIDKE